MNNALAHRGPDDEGVVKLGFATLGMRRLSIVDLAGGQQPMSSPDGQKHLVFNGELYDFKAERERLRQEGYRFRTDSDTEVVLAAITLHGAERVRQFNGMFGLALADLTDQSILLVRDPFGIKPLFYYIGRDGMLAFSSELMSLLKHPEVPTNVDHVALLTMLVDRYVPDPRTLFAGVRQLPAGHWLRWRNGSMELGKYADPVPQPETFENDEDAIEELRYWLDIAVSSQLVADVPVGVLLSGGVDSSTVAAFAARHTSRITTFSVGFAQASYDESQFAGEVSNYLGGEHHELRIEDLGFDLATLDRIVRHAGTPLGDTSCIPTLLLSDYVRQQVKCVLSGDGGDEYFGGYEHMFRWARIWRVSQRVPRAVRWSGMQACRAVAPWVPSSMQTASRHAVKALRLSLHPSPSDQMRRLMALWQPEEARALLSSPISGNALLPAYVSSEIANPAVIGPEEFAMQFLARTSLPNQILEKVDRMSMAASLEIRPVLLDQRIVRFALRLPSSLKTRNGIGKYVLREAGRPYLPKGVYDRPKQGFSPPLHTWFNASFWEYLADAYAPGEAAADYFVPKRVHEVIRQARDVAKTQAFVGIDVASARAWQLALFASWVRLFQPTA